MLIGFNNDVEYQGQMYHIQTEDHGVKDGHITTILFFTGQILDSKKIGYAEDIANVSDEEERKKIIKKRMVNLHREFYKKLFEGQYEESVKRLLSTKGEAKDVEAAGPAKADPPPLPAPEPLKVVPPKPLASPRPEPEAAPESARPEPSRPETSRPIGLSRSELSVPSESVKLGPSKVELDADNRAAAALRRAPRSGVFGRPGGGSQSGLSGSWDASGFRGKAAPSKTAFRGLVWPDDDLRFDLLVARYLEQHPSSEV
ncbi:MAG: hypothetical protein RBU37_01165 [Myxococcota bacterium]|jgi:hypothetical protein|nr:hypothetical protein [Myxococcota bacterium]